MDTCLVTVGELASTGASIPLWAPALAALLLGLGVVALWRVRRRVGVAVLLVCALAVVVTPVPSAMAAAPAVDYSDGCSLITVDEVRLHEEATRLLPGDRVAAMTVRIVNRTSAAVQVSLAAAVDASSPIASGVLLTVQAGSGSTGTLAAGENSQWTVFVELPLAAGNGAQLLAAPLTLTIAATQ